MVGKRGGVGWGDGVKPGGVFCFSPSAVAPGREEGRVREREKRDGGRGGRERGREEGVWWFGSHALI